jgi:HD-like signal output (HDOD) protein
MKRILFVDDEPKILMALRRSLRSCRNEWEMVFAEGGRAALDQCASAPFDVLVSDARMPGMEGPQLLTEVSKLYPDTVRMVLSGQCSRTSVLKCVAVAHQFLSKPCEPGILKSAVQKVCRMRESFRDESTRKAISRTQRLPSQASVLSQLADAIESPRVSVESLADIVVRDLGMSAKVVQLVSSGFFGSPQRVSTAVEAVKLLGIETMRALFTSFATFQPGAEDHANYDLQMLTQHSLAVAAAAKRIAETLTEDATLAGDAYLSGVLHKVGTLLLGERGHAGEACPDPGGYLAALWGLPDAVVQAIAYHCVPSACAEPMCVPLTAVHVANALLERRRGSWEDNDTPLAMDYLQKAGCVDRLKSWREICEACEPEGAPQ